MLVKIGIPNKLRSFFGILLLRTAGSMEADNRSWRSIHLPVAGVNRPVVELSTLVILLEGNNSRERDNFLSNRHFALLAAHSTGKLLVEAGRGIRHHLTLLVYPV